MKVKDALGAYRKRKLASQSRAEATYRSLLGLLGPVAEVEVGDLSPNAMVDLLRDMAVKAPVHAVRAQGYAGPFFEWTIAERLITISPLAPIARPAAAPPRDRLLSLPEIRAVWAVAGDLGYPFGPAIQLLILTLAFREEVAAMRLSELSRAGGSLWIWRPRGRSHGGGDFPIPLPSRAADVIKATLPRRRPGVDFIFSTTGNTPISGWSRAKRRLDGLIGEGDGKAFSRPWRFNDLRASFLAVIQSEAPADPLVLEHCLGRVTGFVGAMAREWIHGEAMLEDHRRVLERWAALVAADEMNEG